MLSVVAVLKGGVMLPFEPESRESMKARFAGATERVYELEEVQGSPETRPGIRREHVFDFEDGMRLIVSRDRAEGQVFLHVSVSFALGRELVGRRLVEEVMLRVVDISGDKVPSGLVRVFSSEHGVVHFLFPDKPMNVVVVPMPSEN